MPITDWQVVVGKFLAALGLMALLLLLTVAFPITVAALGPLDKGTVGRELSRRPAHGRRVRRHRRDGVGVHAQPDRRRAGRLLHLASGCSCSAPSSGCCRLGWRRWRRRMSVVVALHEHRARGHRHARSSSTTRRSSSSACSSRRRRSIAGGGVDGRGSRARPRRARTRSSSSILVIIGVVALNLIAASLSATFRFDGRTTSTRSRRRRRISSPSCPTC